MAVPMSKRRLFPTLAVALAALALAPNALADTPTVTLLAPANGSSVVTPVGTDAYPTYSWRVDWATPEDTIVRHEMATDPGFTQNLSVNTQSCSAANVNCWSSFQSRTAYPAGTTWYWRVGLTTSAGIVYSQPFTFLVVAPPDGDRDGVLDSRDNCPSVANREQKDSDGTRLGDACEVDRFAPRVKLSSATLRRGSMGRVYFRMADARGTLRLEVSLFQAGRKLGTVTETAKNVRWSTQYYLPLQTPKAMPAGAYQLCLRVTDMRGNAARSCARLTLR
jgi:Thrombospondin type 3 repeat